MATLLVGCCEHPIRLRTSDGGLFAKASHQVSERLSAMPAWLTATISYTDESRLSAARQALGVEKLVEVKSSSGRNPALIPTKAGTDWLRKTAGDRLRFVIDRYRRDLRVEAASFFAYSFSQKPGLRFFPWLPAVRCDGKLMDLRNDATAAFLAGGEQGPVPLGAFLDYLAGEQNPLLGPLREGRQLYIAEQGGISDHTEDDLIDLWRHMLDLFFANRLVPLGGAEVGRTSKGHTTFVLTDLGRYLLGAAPDFADDDTETCDIVVQPDFEVVFLSSSPLAEAVVGPMAERIGRDVGALFKITRRSIQGAVATGLEGEAIVARLQELSSKTLPANVIEQIRDWAGQCRTFQVSSALLLECPDAETALRVLSAGGKKLERLSDTVLALRDRKALKGIQTKLRKAGITRQ